MNKKRCRNRRASVTVETAILLPILVGITLGSIDLAQYINLSQLVSNGSREAARIACRDDSESVEKLEKTVRNYFFDAFPNVSSTVIDDAIEIEIYHPNGDHVQNGSLLEFESGDPVCVRIIFDYDRVRWIRGFQLFGDGVNQCVSVGRRE